MAQLELTYVQATLRYAAFLDKKVSEGKPRDELYDDQGEGLTFWRVIEPRVARRNAAAASLISTRYALTTVPTRSDFYCLAYRTLVTRVAMRATGVTDTQVGTLQDVYSGVRATPPLAYYQCSAAYAYLNNVDAELSVSRNGAAMAAAVDVATPNFLGAKTLYDSTIKTLATTVHSTDLDYALFTSYYGAETHDAYLTAAFSGTGSFSGPTKILARVEVCARSILASALRSQCVGSCSLAVTMMSYQSDRSVCVSFRSCLAAHTPALRRATGDQEDRARRHPLPRGARQPQQGHHRGGGHAHARYGGSVLRRQGVRPLPR
jgi:hypothetical protein